MKIKKRNKRSRLRGQRTCGYGFRKKHRGKGSKGGKGMAGTGKRAGHKKTFITKYIPDYFGRHGFKSLKQKKKLEIINLDQIKDRLASFINKGIAKKTSNGIEINLEGYKILGNLDTELNERLIIKTSNISATARAKIEKAGGKVEVI